MFVDLTKSVIAKLGLGSRYTLYFILKGERLIIGNISSPDLYVTMEHDSVIKYLRAATLIE